MRLSSTSPEAERHLLRNFRKYAGYNVAERDSLWHWLTVGQHHGLPTRLLDWTYSPLVALHFATSNVASEADAVVWQVDVETVHRLLPAALSQALQQEGSMVFTVEMLERATTQRGGTIGIYEGMTAFEQMVDEPALVFLEPDSLDERVVNQFALLSAMSDRHLTVDEWLRGSPTVRWRKIRIARSLCMVVRDYLDQSNITERMLFPGLDGLSAWLTRHYSPLASEPPLWHKTETIATDEVLTDN
jgi:hypothetical protein